MLQWPKSYITGKTQQAQYMIVTSTVMVTFEEILKSDPWLISDASPE